MVIKVMLIPYLYQYSSYYVLYIFRILVFRKSSLKDVVFRGCGLYNPRSENISGNKCKTRSFKASYYVVGLLAISYDIIRDIVDNLTCISFSLYFIFPCYCIYVRMNIVMQNSFVLCVLSKYFDKFQKRKRKVHINIHWRELLFLFKCKIFESLSNYFESTLHK